VCNINIKLERKGCNERDRTLLAEKDEKGENPKNLEE